MKIKLIVFILLITIFGVLAVVGQTNNSRGGGESFTVYLSISLGVLPDNIHLLPQNLHELVPEDGYILHQTGVAAYYGDTVFDLLLRETRAAGIHMAFRNVPMFNSAYIEGINNIFEFDAGPLSGWMYRVNDWFPNFGSSDYLLSSGDIVEWIYTIDLGRDISY